MLKMTFLILFQEPEPDEEGENEPDDRFDTLTLMGSVRLAPYG